MSSRVKRLRPRFDQPVPVTPQCCVPIKFNRHQRGWYMANHRKPKCEELGYDPERCMFSAAFMIDKKPYCPRHAGMRAIEILES